MKKVKKTKIIGYDWSELVPYILDKDYDGEKDKELLNELDKKIMELSIILESKNKTKKDLYKLKIIRKYINRLVIGKMKYCCSGELFVGLSKIKDNSTFLRFVSLLLPNCWY